MVKPMVVGSLVVAALATAMGVGLNAANASGEVSGVAFVLGAGLAGLIGSEVSRHMPPRQR